jgi:hypothetical protein
MTKMKLRSKTSALGPSLALLLCSALAAAANLVTYQIDMSVQTTLGNFNPGTDRVLVAGNFSTPDWIPPLTTAFVLTNDPGNNPHIYQNTFNNDIATSGFENHKFIIDVGSTATILNWETIDNRFFQVAAGDQTLPVVFYNNVTNANTLVVTQVTFAVNMSVQEALGNFAPATDFVYVAGDVFNNNWAAGAQVLTNSLVDTNVWQGTFTLTNTVGGTVNYKFIMNTFATGQVWENDGVGPNGAQNRQFTFTNETTTLPAAYFNNITSFSSLVTTQVTFKVNLAAQIARGAFDPNVGTVSVAGDILNNWNPLTSALTQTLTNTSVWSGTFDVTNTVGAPVNYKFVLNGGGTWEDDGVGPNGANNRQFIFTNLTTVLPDVYFNNLGNLGALTISPVSAGQVTVSWTAGPLIRLQTNAPLTGTWGDVPDTLGASSANVSIAPSNTYFRLIGP